MQEDLEAEFQSLFSLLEELKEGMLMKIKQDRASRTYELQVCGGPPDPTPGPIPHGTPQTQQSPYGFRVCPQTCCLPTLRLGEIPKGLRCPEPDSPGVLASPPLFLGLFSAPSLALIHQFPPTPAPLGLRFSHLLPPLLLCHQSPTPMSGCSLSSVLTQHLQFLSPSHGSPRSGNIPSCKMLPPAPRHNPAAPGVLDSRPRHWGCLRTSWTTS